MQLKNLFGGVFFFGAVASNSWADTPTPQEVAPLISAAIQREAQAWNAQMQPTGQVPSNTPPPRTSAPKQTDVNPPIYIVGSEHVGTIVLEGDSSPPARHVAYWPIYKKPQSDLEKMGGDLIKQPVAYAYKNGTGRWQVTLTPPKDETPWYKFW
jgi:hypothetical protein